MRFIIAVLAAFLVLMFDLNGSSGETPSYASTIQASPPSQDGESEAASFADRFFIESPIGSGGLFATVAYETPALPNRSDNIAAEPPASAMDAFCRALTDAAEANAVRADLPHEAPCGGVGGLSTARDFTFVRALPAPSITMIIRKADAAARAARSGRARNRLALRFARSNPGGSRPGMLRRVVAGHAKARLTKGRATHLASR